MFGTKSYHEIGLHVSLLLRQHGGVSLDVNDWFRNERVTRVPASSYPLRNTHVYAIRGCHIAIFAWVKSIYTAAVFRSSQQVQAFALYS